MKKIENSFSIFLIILFIIILVLCLCLCFKPKIIEEKKQPKKQIFVKN